MSNLIANATPEQKRYGFLQALIELNEKPLNVIIEAALNFYPYLLLQPGDWVLSEGGDFEKVETHWFFNGNGNSPYWFAGGWPSIYGNGDCVSYCDVGAGHDFRCILISVPSLNKETGFILSPSKFESLKDYVGKTLITTDGTTLLGADDKAGIAEIVTAAEYLLAHPEIKHGKIAIGFTPDEEIGRGAHKFDVAKFGAEWAYTMDGGEVGELEYENFNAAGAVVKIHGLSVHPGYAFGKMINASLLAAEFIKMLPENETPSTTKCFEGFYHLMEIKADVSEAKLQYIIRDHDEAKFEARKKFMEEKVAEFNEKFGKGTAEVEIKEQYRNMKQQFEGKMHIVDIAEQAMKDANIEPKIKAMRGGTDGAQLSYMGLPCPNIFAGGINFHGPYEYVALESMEKAVKVIINIAKAIKKQ